MRSPLRSTTLAPPPEQGRGVEGGLHYQAETWEELRKVDKR